MMVFMQLITVQRYHDRTDATWSDWAPVKNILSVEEDEVVSVGKPTLILRHVNSPVNNTTESVEVIE